jgi:hypothetical protein
LTQEQLYQAQITRLAQMGMTPADVPAALDKLRNRFNYMLAEAKKGREATGEAASQS